MQKVSTSQEKISLKISPRILYQLFLKIFEQIDDKKFIQNPQILENLKSMIYYFNRDQKFLQVNALAELSKHFIQKDLLIIRGCGKTSMMKVFEPLFAYPLRGCSQAFLTYQANQAVELYKSCQSPTEKELFWKNTFRGIRHFDDFKIERLASNYGEANLVKDIFEKPYSARQKNHISCNYVHRRAAHPQATLGEFGQLYGPRVYDGLIEMCNILQFKGKSFIK